MRVSDDLIATFRAADKSDLPEIGSIADPRQRALWTLHLGQARAGVEMMTPAEISIVLRDVFGIALPRQKIEGMLSQEKQAVAKRKKNGKRAYQVMQAGIDEVEGISSSVLLIEPERALTSLRATEAVLGTLMGTVKVCDPYVDGRTLDLLGNCTGGRGIMLLTANVHKQTAFKRDTKAFAREHGNILEVRIAQAGVLHDRYVIAEDGMLLFGTSLNGLGFKQSLSCPSARTFAPRPKRRSTPIGRRRRLYRTASS